MPGAVARADAPRTRASLAADLHSLGVQAGGGALAVIQALEDVLTPQRELVGFAVNVWRTTSAPPPAADTD